MVNRPNSVDAVGAPVDRWVDFVPGWRAAVKPLTGKSLAIARQVNESATHEVTMRYVCGLTREMELLHEGRRFDINSIVDSDEKHYEHVLICQELG